ncbi:hypothetical protein VNI00_014199 [Paramarasmius palmivorus]|uniref:Retrotransposon gag domain-containing protein n=1 Tax=Paramarasmius palmivorus TaxID=297713 RepID=A0AAW0BUA3_9AGAR
MTPSSEPSRCLAETGSDDTSTGQNRRASTQELELIPKVVPEAEMTPEKEATPISPKSRTPSPKPISPDESVSRGFLHSLDVEDHHDEDHYLIRQIWHQSQGGQNLPIHPNHIMTPPQSQNVTEDLPEDIGLNLPNEFTGDESETEGFLLMCEEYLAVNDRVYTTNQAKIAFVLSFCRGRANDHAHQKRRAYILSGYPEYSVFREQFLKDFSPRDVKAKAREDLVFFQQTGDVTNFIIRFEILTRKANITDKVILQDMFMRKLKPRLRMRILDMDTVPTTLEGWYEAAKEV